MTKKTPTEIKQLVERGIAAELFVKAATETFNEIKRELIAAAENHADEFLPTTGGGSTLTFEADDGSAARVTFPAAKLKAAINPETKDGGAALDKLRAFKDVLFTPVLLYAPVDNFREKVRGFFNAREAASIIKKCETASPASVAFETVDRSAKKGAAK